jgi:hypothetical protein
MNGDDRRSKEALTPTLSRTTRRGRKAKCNSPALVLDQRRSIGFACAFAAETNAVAVGVLDVHFACTPGEVGESLGDVGFARAASADDDD